MPRAIARVILIVAGWVAIAATSQATVIFKVDDGQLVGAENIDVGGTFYDVAFVDGSCIALSPGCDDISDFDYDGSAFAQAAARVLLEQVFVNVGSDAKTQYDSVPSLVFGCEEIVGDEACVTLIPFAIEGKDVGAWIATNKPGQAENSVGTGGMGSAALPEGREHLNFAQFSLASTAVPSPGTLALASTAVSGPATLAPVSTAVLGPATLGPASTAVSGPATLALVFCPLLLLMVTRAGGKA